MSDKAKRHVVPFGDVGIVYKVPDDVGKEVVSLVEAKRLMTETATKSDYNWLLREFNDQELVFYVAALSSNPRANVRPWGSYIVERVISVKRDPQAVEELRVGPTIDLYEKGRRGVKGGMSETEVMAVLGQPVSIDQLGPFGSFDYNYDGLKVRFLDNEVAYIQEVK